MQVSVQYAREHLDDLLVSAQPGEEIEIARDGQPLARLTVMPTRVTPQQRSERILGTGRGTFISSLDDQWQSIKDEDARLMSDAPLITTGEV